jgi:hypothetical protein
LKHITGRTRGLDESRYDFARRTGPEGPVSSLRINPDISEQDAQQRKAVCGSYLHLILQSTSQEKKPLGNQELQPIYIMATQILGLSRLETEELAPDSELWLEFCINTSDSRDPHYFGDVNPH